MRKGAIIFIILLSFLLFLGCTKKGCGNGICDSASESISNCPQDCNAQALQPVCGNLACEPPEDVQSCPADCSTGSLCSNGIEDGGENCSNCPTDIKCAGDEKCTSGMCEKIPFNELLSLKIADCKTKESYVQRDLCIVGVGKSLETDFVCDSLERLAKDDCYNELAISLGKYEICSRVRNSELANSCLYGVAYAADNADICEIIDAGVMLEDSNNTLRDMCLKEVAIEIADKGTCLKVSDTRLRDYCAYDVALMRADGNICASISQIYIDGNYLRDDCYLLLGEDDASVCPEIIDENRSVGCFENAAIKALDKSLCLEISSETKKGYCLKYIALGVPDYRICTEISDSKISQQCLVDISGIVPSAEICPLIDDVELRLGCDYNAAVANLDVNRCKAIDSSKIRNKCIRVVAAGKGDASLCEGIGKEDIAGRDECYAEIAVSKLSPEICEKATTAQYYIPCYSDIALSAARPSICNDAKKNFVIEAYSSKDSCYYNYAKGADDESYCSSIASSVLRDKCRAET